MSNSRKRRCEQTSKRRHDKAAMTTTNGTAIVPYDLPYLQSATQLSAANTVTLCYIHSMFGICLIISAFQFVRILTVIWDICGKYSHVSFCDVVGSSSASCLKSFEHANQLTVRVSNRHTQTRVPYMYYHYFVFLHTNTWVSCQQNYSNTNNYTVLFTPLENNHYQTLYLKHYSFDRYNPL